MQWERPPDHTARFPGSHASRPLHHAHHRLAHLVSDSNTHHPNFSPRWSYLIVSYIQNEHALTIPQMVDGLGALPRLVGRHDGPNGVRYVPSASSIAGP